jgi:hypothetical protein
MQRSHLRPASVLVWFILGGACSSDRYELRQSRQGSLYRLDKRTGSVYLVSDSQLLRLSAVAEDTNALLRTPHQWPSLHYRFGGDSTIVATLTTMWASGRVHYILRFQPTRPFYSALRRSRANDAYLRVHMQDSAGFSLVTVDVATDALELGPGSPASYYELQGSGTCDASGYSRIASWTIAYNL